MSGVGGGDYTGGGGADGSGGGTEYVDAQGQYYGNVPAAAVGGGESEYYYYAPTGDASTDPNNAQYYYNDPNRDQQLHTSNTRPSDTTTQTHTKQPPHNTDTDTGAKKEVFDGRNLAAAEGRKLFIGGVSWETTDEAFKKFFERFGPIEEAIIMRVRGTGVSRGFGFVTYKDAASADKVAQSSYLELDGRKIDAKKAEPKDESSKGGTGGRLEPQDAPIQPYYGDEHNSPSVQGVKKIFVGGLSQDTTQEDLTAFFSKFGSVTEAQVMYDQATGKSRGFGFVSFSDSKAVDAVVDRNGQHYIHEKRIDCKKAFPKNAPDHPSKLKQAFPAALGPGPRGGGRVDPNLAYDAYGYGPQGGYDMYGYAQGGYPPIDPNAAAQGYPEYDQSAYAYGYDQYGYDYSQQDYYGYGSQVDEYGNPVAPPAVSGAPPAPPAGQAPPPQGGGYYPPSGGRPSSGGHGPPSGGRGGYGSRDRDSRDSRDSRSGGGYSRHRSSRDDRGSSYHPYR